MANCNISAGIGVDCSDLRRVGGVNKRVWFFNTDGVTYTTNVSGYITGISFPTYEGLYAFEGKKNSHSSGYQLINQEGANKFFQHDSVIKLFATTPADQEVIEDLAVASVGIIVETNNREFVLYGKNNGIDLVSLTGNTGTVGASDVTSTLTFQGEEPEMPKFVLSTDYETTLTLVESYEV